MTFIEDYKALQLKTPRIAIINTNSENSTYTNYSTFNRDCYLGFGLHYSEDTYYSNYCTKLTSCSDCLDVEKSELCYELVFCEKCYDCGFSGYLMACSNCDFCYDLANCQYCFLCTCMQNQTYCILNKRVSKEEFEVKRKELIGTKTPAQLLQMLDELREKVPQRQFFQKNCENCLGTELRNCKNVFYSYRVKNSEDVIYGGTHVSEVKSSMDIDNCAATLSEELYNTIGTTNSYGLVCCNSSWMSQNLYYCDNVYNSHDCLGCISRNHAEYEILNVKYSKEEYFARFDEIKHELLSQGQWGQMWMPTTYPHEDTLTALYYPEN